MLFVSYSWSIGEGLGYGHLMIERPEPRTSEDVQDLINHIKVTMEEPDASVIILNWKVLK